MIIFLVKRRASGGAEAPGRPAQPIEVSTAGVSFIQAEAANDQQAAAARAVPVEAAGGMAAIGRLEDAEALIEGKAGTIITR
jgi:hypothetical protein